MNLQEFINKYNNKLVNTSGEISTNYASENPGGYGPYQCVDLAKAYMRDMYGITGSYGDAKNYARNVANNHNQLEFITPNSGKPLQAGDVISFGPTPNNTYGHIGIVTEVSSKGFIMLDQNGTTDSYGWGRWVDRIQKRNRTYKNIVGWARPKNMTPHAPLSGEIWNEERPYDIATEAEIDTMLIRAFGETADFYAIFRRIWDGLEFDPKATRAILLIRTGRRHNNNHEFIFDRLTAAQYILYIKRVWNNEERKIATEKDLKELMGKYFPNQNIIDVCRRYFGEIQEDANLLITFRRAWYKYNGIKDFKYTRDETLGMVLKMKKDLDGHI